MVWAINEGRQCAREIDLTLQNDTRLPVTGGVIKRSWVPPRIEQGPSDASSSSSFESVFVSEAPIEEGVLE